MDFAKRIIKKGSSNPISNISIPRWDDFAGIRDWVNQIAYSKALKPPLWQRFVASAGFVFAVRIALVSSNTVVFQFVCGTVCLHFMRTGLKKISGKPPVDRAALKQAFVEAHLVAQTQGILAELFKMRSERGQEFPIQQNGILALSLIWFQQFGYGLSEGSIRRVGIDLGLGFVFFLMKGWEEKKDQSLSWSAASEAVRENLKLD